MPRPGSTPRKDVDDVKASRSVFRRARPGSNKDAVETRELLPEASTPLSGVSAPVFFVASYEDGAKRTQTNYDPDRVEPKATPIPRHAPDDADVLFRLFRIR